MQFCLLLFSFQVRWRLCIWSDRYSNDLCQNRETLLKLPNIPFSLQPFAFSAIECNKRTMEYIVSQQFVMMALVPLNGLQLKNQVQCSMETIRAKACGCRYFESIGMLWWTLQMWLKMWGLFRKDSKTGPCDPAHLPFRSRRRCGRAVRSLRLLRALRALLALRTLVTLRALRASCSHWARTSHTAQTL